MKRPTSGLSLYSTYVGAEAHLQIHYCCGPSTHSFPQFASVGKEGKKGAKLVFVQVGQLGKSRSGWRPEGSSLSLSLCDGIIRILL